VRTDSNGLDINVENQYNFRKFVGLRKIYPDNNYDKRYHKSL
jgi:hypothetical protein